MIAVEIFFTSMSSKSLQNLIFSIVTAALFIVSAHFAQQFILWLLLTMQILSITIFTHTKKESMMS